MTPLRRRWKVVLAVVLGVPLLAGAALWLWLPSDEELAARASVALEKALGVPVSVGALHWRLLPSPAVVLEDAVTRQDKPISIRRLTMYPELGALLHRRVKISRAELDGAVVPQLSLRGLGKDGNNGDDADPSASRFTLDDVPLTRFVFRDVSWVSRRGIAVVYDGEADFDAAWRPRTASLRRPGVTPAADLLLTRQGDDDRWTARINVGGGTGHGEVQLLTRGSGRLHLSGKLQPRGIEVASALAAFNRRSAVAGKASGETTLSADGDTVGELAQTLHTRTPFTMGASTILRFDLDKAIRTAGKEHAGQTPLESITGQLDTQNTPDGMVSTYTDLKARSGALTASGQARLANRRIDAEFAVDLVDGLVGVPLKVTGPLDNVSFSVPPGAIAGAVVGTAVLPGIGTAIGARIGATLGKLFGASPAPAAKASQPKPATKK